MAPDSAPDSQAKIDGSAFQVHPSEPQASDCVWCGHPSVVAVLNEHVKKSHVYIYACGLHKHLAEAVGRLEQEDR